MERYKRLLLKGIENGRVAFIGPQIVQIDLTNRCNSSCIGCWVHSPLLGDMRMSKEESKIQLSFEKVKELINDLSKTGTQEIFLSGSGEPFMYPQIMEVLELIKEKGMRCNIVTNFTLLNSKRIKRLVELKIDLITASLWAGDAQTYLKTHPGESEREFYQIKDSLKEINSLKKNRNKHYPKIKVYNVICNLNCANIEEMVDFVLETGVEFLEFQVIDIIEGKTDCLALSREDIDSLNEQFKGLLSRKDHHFFELGDEKFLPLLFQEAKFSKEIREFPGRFLRMPSRFILKAWKEDKGGRKVVCRVLSCPAGKTTWPPTDSNPVISDEKSSFVFKFKPRHCQGCGFSNVCPVDNKGRADIDYMSILGFGSFKRRLNTDKVYQGVYEKDIINSIPCYIGWTYARVLTNGDVIPCCKAHLVPMGSIYSQSFKQIWHSPAYGEFRYKAKNFTKRDPYFKGINCYKSCDNIGMNLETHKEVLEKRMSLRGGRGDSSPVITREPRRGDRSNLKTGSEQAVQSQEIVALSSFARNDKKKEKAAITVLANQFKQGNLNPQYHQFGKGMVIDGGQGYGFAEYEITFVQSGRYELWARYASGESRPVEIYFDGNLVREDGLAQVTGGWTKKYLYWFMEVTLSIPSGRHTLRIYSSNLIPHIEKFSFIEEGKKFISSEEKIYRHPSALRLFREKVRQIGLGSSLLKLMDHLKSGRFLKDYLDIIGIFDGSYAYKGPYLAQIDLTNRCNNNCIGCWCNSPLLGEKGMDSITKQMTLPYELVKELIDELSQMGTKEIYYSGGGEPFKHPQIMDILEYSKKKGMVCYVNTNFTLLNVERIKKIVDLKIDHFTVSTWAGTAETYDATHPNKTKETFYQIRENLRLLNSLKKEVPYVKLYNVIFSMNYHEIEKMLDFALESNCESVEFTMIDTMPGKTDKLLLNEEQNGELLEKCRDIKARLDKDFYLDNRLLLFRFGQFLRRISNQKDVTTGKYDRNIIDQAPCYIGWLFARVLPDGNVNSCLKSHRSPVGNLYKDSFKQIWNNPAQQHFRKKALVYKKDDPFFRLVGNDPDTKEAGCYKSCDDIGRNIHMHNKIMSLTPIERGMLHLAANFKKRRRNKLQTTNYKLQTTKDIPRDIGGIFNGRQAFIGPEHVVIDLTNRCNERCIGCWMYSPLLKEKRPSPERLREELPTEVVKRLIDELKDMGIKRIRFTGGGEPFIHPDILELIEYVKRKGLILAVTTNFSLVKDKMVKELIKLGLDDLSVSLWAGDAQTYIKTHPGRKEEDFYQIKENLKLVSTPLDSKHLTGASLKNAVPYLTLCNVILNQNYTRMKEMLDFAIELKANAIYFTVVDTIFGKTDSLMLSQKEIDSVLKEVHLIKKRIDDLPIESRIELDNFAGFIRRISNKDVGNGFYDRNIIDTIPCYVGWLFSRIMANGDVSPCCRGVNLPLGNIYKQSFSDIWYGQRYNEFRCKAKYLSKSDLYFSKIGCQRSCDNLMHNEQMHKRVMYICI